METADQNQSGNASPSSTEAESVDKQTRERSQIEFTYTDLGPAVDLVTTLHERGGGSAERDQLAAWMNQSVGGGTFRSRVSAAVMFGLVSADRGRIHMTPLGRTVVDPARRASALATAFLNVPLFNAMFEKFKGYSLPPAAAIERQMLELGVPAKQKERARQTFQKSAITAGYIDQQTGRFVRPAVPDGESQAEPPPLSQDSDLHGGNGGSGGGDDYHPFIKGLLQTLPETGGKWAHKDRVKWLRLAANAFDMIYEGDGEIEIKEKAKSDATE